MKKKWVWLVLGMLVCVAGCGEDKQSDRKTTETVTRQDTLEEVVLEENAESEESIKESDDLEDQKSANAEVKETEALETEVMEDLDDSLTFCDVKLSGIADTEYEILSVAGGETGPVVKVDFGGEVKTVTLDFEYDELGIDRSSYEFEIADVDQDGRDDVLVKMYYPNELQEHLQRARLYHIENEEFVLWSDLSKEFVQEFLYESKIEPSKIILDTMWISYDAEGEKIVSDYTLELNVVDGEIKNAW